MTNFRQCSNYVIPIRCRSFESTYHRYTNHGLTTSTQPRKKARENQHVEKKPRPSRGLFTRRSLSLSLSKRDLASIARICVPRHFRPLLSLIADINFRAPRRRQRVESFLFAVYFSNKPPSQRRRLVSPARGCEDLF